ncbi:LuxR C-terminal-related transcriptional regulator [Microbacterium sp. BWT-B31]|uniref:LuxR C-terminal-related transcriptional regulator n=1 Tax=Microbacterium sp. BWT-B31 TaxID=3232072 RepID=UPI0035277DAA
MSTQEAVSESQLLTTALKDLSRRTRFPLVFGGFAGDGGVPITAILGNRTRRLEGLIVRAGRGLGGRAFTELRPRMTPDYGSSRHITHDYDGHVLGEGIATLLAVPVVVHGRTRGMLYGGTWSNLSVGDVTATPAVQVAEALANELRVRDEIERRLSAHPLARAAAPGIDAARQEELRATYAELRSIAASVTDPATRDRLVALERRLAGISGDEGLREASALEVRLSPRELDVLACAALGQTNAQIAMSLALKEVTVKSYLQSAMSKLNASTRIAAVARARRLGILP